MIMYKLSCVILLSSTVSHVNRKSSALFSFCQTRQVSCNLKNKGDVTLYNKKLIVSSSETFGFDPILFVLLWCSGSDH